MSAGTPHHRPNTRHPEELKHLLADGGAPELMQRWQNLDVDHDVPDLAGYNVAGTTTYLDKDFFRALLDPAYAKELGIGPIDTGMTEENTVDCLLTHERTEKVLLDADNDIDSYQAAHELATVAEHERVRALGGSPIRYERGLKKAIAWCERKKIALVDGDFACAPYLDHPDDQDRRALKQFRRLGVDDAFKASRRTVHYARSTDPDHCEACSHWQGDLPEPLSRCSEVDGAVRADRWCARYDAMEVRAFDHNAHAAWRQKAIGRRVGARAAA